MSEVTDDPRRGRFVLSTQGHREAELVYKRVGDRLYLLHTEVPRSLRGRGIGGQLVGAALARATRDGLTMVPLCPFARRWLRERATADEHDRRIQHDLEPGAAGK